MTDKMTKAERAELGSLIRKREKVMKSIADERAGVMMADFEAQSAAIYSYDDDAVWAEAVKDAEAAVQLAEQVIAKRCEERGIPREFAPTLKVGWFGRGQNAVAERRAELRQVAKKRIEAITLEAKAKIERMSLDAQTAVTMSGLESEAAKAFLEHMPKIEVLMPPVSAVEIKQLVDSRNEEHQRRRNAYSDYN